MEGTASTPIACGVGAPQPVKKEKSMWFCCHAIGIWVGWGGGPGTSRDSRITESQKKGEGASGQQDRKRGHGKRVPKRMS